MSKRAPWWNLVHVRSMNSPWGDPGHQVVWRYEVCGPNADGRMVRLAVDSFQPSLSKAAGLLADSMRIEGMDPYELVEL